MKTKKQPESIADRVVLLRKEYNLTVDKFGIMLNKSGVAVYNIEKGITKTPQESTIELMVEVFGTTRDWLIHGVGQMLPAGKLSIGSNNDNVCKEAISALSQQLKFMNDQYAVMTGILQNFTTQRPVA
jgi:transcriptional regulator with XRE-family HTH domain